MPVVTRTLENARVTVEPPSEVEPDDTVKVQVTLPYAGKGGESITKEINKHMKRVEPTLKARIAFKAKRLGSYVNIKDKV